MARNRYSQPSTFSNLTNGNGDEEKKKSKKQLTHKALASKPNITKIIRSSKSEPPKSAEFDAITGNFVKYVPISDEKLRGMALSEKANMESTSHGGEGGTYWWNDYLADN